MIRNQQKQKTNEPTETIRRRLVRPIAFLVWIFFFGNFLGKCWPLRKEKEMRKKEPPKKSSKGETECKPGKTQGEGASRSRAFSRAR